MTNINFRCESMLASQCIQMIHLPQLILFGEDEGLANISLISLNNRYAKA